MVFFPEVNPLRPIAVLAVAMAGLGAGPARAVEPFVLKDIRVEGLQRADAGTVFAALPFRIGDTYSDDKGAIALRSLFATGLFKDVRIEIDGEVVVVIVEERPVIQTVTFAGLKEFDKDQLIKSLKDTGIGEGLPFDKALIDRAEQEIKRQYLSRSLYGAEVVTTITPVERNRVNVTFTMTEGDAAKIAEIRIIGSKVFSEGTLTGLMELTTSGWLTWYTKNDRYSRAKLNADLETIRSYYLNRGYLEFNVDSTQVTISPDKQEISITITVTEGQLYTVTAVKLQGDFLGKDDEFRELVRIKPGAPYRAQDATDTTKAFSDRFGLYGYAFARVETESRPRRAGSASSSSSPPGTVLSLAVSGTIPTITDLRRVEQGARGLLVGRLVGHRRHVDGVARVHQLAQPAALQRLREPRRARLRELGDLDAVPLAEDGVGHACTVPKPAFDSTPSRTPPTALPWSAHSRPASPQAPRCSRTCDEYTTAAMELQVAT